MKATRAGDALLRDDDLGAHMSIAGGLHLALERGHALGCGAVQIFLKNQRQWAARPLTADDVRAFHAAFLFAAALAAVAAFTASRIPRIALWDPAGKTKPSP